MKKDQNGFGAPAILIVILVIALIGGIGYFVYVKNTESKVGEVPPEVTKKVKTMSDAAAKSAEAATISDSLKENISAAIGSKNTAALEGYMADSVTVVIAASEKGGAVSKTEAIQDLNYLSNAAAPWDFALSEATLTTYKNGFYKDHFGDMTLVGKSSDNYVVSFHVNDSGKIDKIFMAVNADLLV